jgi:hypothetical protein
MVIDYQDWLSAAAARTRAASASAASCAWRSLHSRLSPPLPTGERRRSINSGGGGEEEEEGPEALRPTDSGAALLLRWRGPAPRR